MTELFEKSIRVLELPRVLALLEQKAVSDAAKEKARSLEPSTDIDEVRRLLDETDAAREMILLKGSPSFSGVKDVSEALARAEEAGLDLVCISPKAVPPVCKIIDYGKYRYEQARKEKEAKKKQKVMEVKEIPLTVDLVAAAGASSANTKFTIDPPSITLAGDSAVLSGINRISLSTIDLSDFSSTFTDTYAIRYDDGLKNLSGTTEATVTIEVLGLETRDYAVSSENMSCVNVTDGYSAEILSDSLVVKLRGAPEQLQEVKSENIRVVADLKDYNTSTGQFMPTVKISVDGFTDVGAIGNYTISIELKKG